MKHPKFVGHPYFDTEIDAVNALADKLHIDVDSLVVPARVHPVACIEKMKLFLGIYWEALPKGNDRLPGDLADDKRRAEASRSHLPPNRRSMPAPVEVLSVLARAGPYRNEVDKLARRRQWPRQTDPVSDAEVEAFETLNTALIRGVAKVWAEALKPHARNVCKQVRHFHTVTVIHCQSSHINSYND